MGVAEAVVALQAHLAVTRVVEEACRRVVALCHAAGNWQPAADAGELEALVAVMWAHPQVAKVQECGCGVLASVCSGSNAAALARRQRAAGAGALEAAVAAMQAHPQVAGLQEHGCRTLATMCIGTDATGLARKQRAAELGGRGAAAAALQAHPGDAEVQRFGQQVIDRIGG